MAKSKKMKLRQSHTALSKFVKSLCAASDRHFGGPAGRSDLAQKQYAKARRLLAQAPSSRTL